MTPKTIWVTAIVLGSLPELEGKALLLKMPHMLDMGLGEIELELTRKPLPEDFLSRKVLCKLPREKSTTWL